MTGKLGWLATRLEEIPARIGRAVAGWDEVRLGAARGGEWSAVEILAHLRAGDAIFAPRVGAILARDDAPLPAFDERSWAIAAGYADVPFRDSLSDFAASRAETVRLLQRARPGGWARAGIHEARGPITLTDLVANWLAHEEEHCAQLEAMGGAPALPDVSAPEGEPAREP